MPNNAVDVVTATPRSRSARRATSATLTALDMAASRARSSTGRGADAEASSRTAET
eukprot:CAMPEP_0175604556 /NCGR_PEP_ID=MMETSP0096-20121207/59731_1 /TAXON_ID=311494 /ORGANISM="Alexandrium monilatum, Strain CCMP3105" /LENGTH=55 /DNA_ID=CAMNT_0016909299 /DNA_START=38 /DNA_END=205 /DNA_ORIENTATION=+